jgi:hypothetical protein
MPNYVKIPNIDLELIKSEMAALFTNITGWYTYEDCANNKTANHAVIKLLPFNDMFGVETARIVTQLNLRYGNLKAVSLDLFKPVGRIDPCKNGGLTPQDAGEEVSIAIPLSGGPVHYSWFKYTGEYSHEILHAEDYLNRYIPSNVDLINHEEIIKIDSVTVCRVGKLHSLVNLNNNVAVHANLIFENQSLLLEDLENNTLLGQLVI